jgi:uncharacterized protein involved in type VI secretion and phage assembly
MSDRTLYFNMDRSHIVGDGVRGCLLVKSEAGGIYALTDVVLERCSRTDFSEVRASARVNAFQGGVTTMTKASNFILRSTSHPDRPRVKVSVLLTVQNYATNSTLAFASVVIDAVSGSTEIATLLDTVEWIPAASLRLTPVMHLTRSCTDVRVFRTSWACNCDPITAPDV